MRGGYGVLLWGLLGGCMASEPKLTPTANGASLHGAQATSGRAQTDSAPNLSLKVAEMGEQTGGEFGLTVPMLLLTVQNLGGAAIEVPELGVDMIVSLRMTLTPQGRDGKREVRYATLLRPWSVQLAPLSPGGKLQQGLSPLSVLRRDVPLPVGRYQVGVCVPPSREAPYPSRFTDLYGGQCSNEIAIEVTRKRR